MCVHRMYWSSVSFCVPMAASCHGEWLGCAGGSSNGWRYWSTRLKGQVCTHTHTHTHTHSCTHTHTLTLSCVSLSFFCLPSHVHMYIHVHTHTHTCKQQTHTYARTHADREINFTQLHAGLLPQYRPALRSGKPRTNHRSNYKWKRYNVYFKDWVCVLGYLSVWLEFAETDYCICMFLKQEKKKKKKRCMYVWITSCTISIE